MTGIIRCSPIAVQFEKAAEMAKIQWKALGKIRSVSMIREKGQV